MNEFDLTAAYLRTVLLYDESTGKFSWIKNQRKDYMARKEAGCVRYDGRRQIGVKGKSYLASRLAWLYQYGAWPKKQIDHINGNRADDRICNLRDVPNRINCENKRAPMSNNKSGRLGVWRHHNNKWWIARIVVNGKTIFLGSFDDADKAHGAYLDAKRKMHKGNTI